MNGVAKKRLKYVIGSGNSNVKAVSVTEIQKGKHHGHENIARSLVLMKPTGSSTSMSM